MANDVAYEHREYTSIGKKAEKDFCDAVLRINPHCVITKSSDSQDMFGHYDYIIDCVSFDVKARRNMDMLNYKNDKYTMLELVNRNGDKGSLYGNAQYFAFEMITPILKCFVIVPRLELVKYVEANTEDIFVTTMTESINKKYQGFNTKYVLTGVSFEEISKLKNFKIIHKL